jgi:hypothetical protein
MLAIDPPLGRSARFTVMIITCRKKERFRRLSFQPGFSDSIAFFHKAIAEQLHPAGLSLPPLSPAAPESMPASAVPESTIAASLPESCL